MKVKATDKYQKLNVQDNELKKIPAEGEEFEITEERYRVLTGQNKFNEVFVEKVEEKPVIETAVKKSKKETATKNKKK